MSDVGQNRKSSMRAHVFRFAPESGHRAMQSACPFRADSVAKSKVAAVQIFGENLKRKEGDDSQAPVALPKSPINLAQGDEVPQIITRITRQRLSEFFDISCKTTFATQSATNRYPSPRCSLGRYDRMMPRAQTEAANTGGRGALADDRTTNPFR
jgi:hypothetical protein